jgi:hypothetical protein
MFTTVYSSNIVYSNANLSFNFRYMSLISLCVVSEISAN